jgi:hypothetical protein
MSLVKLSEAVKITGLTSKQIFGLVKERKISYEKTGEGRHARYKYDADEYVEKEGFGVSAARVKKEVRAFAIPGVVGQDNPNSEID